MPLSWDLYMWEVRTCSCFTSELGLKLSALKPPVEDVTLSGFDPVLRYRLLLLCRSGCVRVEEGGGKPRLLFLVSGIDMGGAGVPPEELISQWSHFVPEKHISQLLATPDVESSSSVSM